MRDSLLRTRWAAIGAAMAVALGGGGLGFAYATTSSGERATYLPISPCRLADTRPGLDTVGPRTTPLGAGETYTLTGWGSVGGCNLPAGTAGLALNVTAVGATSPTYLTLWPANVPLPRASNLNPSPGQPPTPNAVNVDLSPTGQFSIFNLAGEVHVLVDVVGIYDDHDHDDRYLTKAELQSELEALKAANATQDAYLASVLPGVPTQAQLQSELEALKAANATQDAYLASVLLGYATKAQLQSDVDALKAANATQDAYLSSVLLGYATKAQLQSDVDALKAANATQDTYTRSVLLGTAPVPSGQTVKGYGTFDHSIIADNEDVFVAVQLPGKASTALTPDKVNFAPIVTLVGDGDATCTGTVDAPTAPPGKVCLYLGMNYHVDGMSGTSAMQPAFDDQFFLVYGNAAGTPGTDMYFRFSWAYRAP